MRENRPGRKPALRQRIADTEAQLRDTLGGAMPQRAAWTGGYSSAEVIGQGGFDVVLTNPPYVESRSSSLSSELKDAYINQTLIDWGERLPRGSDLLIYFTLVPRDCCIALERDASSLKTLG